MHRAPVDPPSTRELIRGRLQRGGIERGDDYVLVGGDGRTDLEHVINLVRGGLQPPIFALYSVKHKIPAI